MIETSGVVDLAADPVDHTLWLVQGSTRRHYRLTGQVRQTRTFGSAKLRAVVVYTDLLPPTLAFTTPLANALLNTNHPALTLRYGDSGQGSDPDTLQLQVNDVPLAVSCTATAPELTCTPSTALPEGPVTLSATIEDFAGNLSTPATLALTIDTVAPVITVTTPTAGLVTNQATQTLTGSLSEVATLTLNGQVLPVAANRTFT